MGSLRLALLGAFPYPLPQGSQIFFEDQARGLERAGCTCTLLTYGRGAGPPPADLRVIAAPAIAAPRRMRSGPSFAKPLADAALLRTWLATCRTERFDAVLAHNAEAAVVGLAARRATGVPVCYVVHTLLGVELSSYLPQLVAASADTLGARIDHALARRADGVLVLAHTAEHALRPWARGPLAVVPPGAMPGPALTDAVIEDACTRHGLARDGYVLYSGNLDGYQELELLDAAATRLPQGSAPVVVATHAAVDDAARRALPALRFVQVDDFETMRALTFGARTLVLTRRRVGGYPIKLLNYMEAGRAIVAFDTVAEGLVHGISAWLLDSRGLATATAEALADALSRLDSEPTLRAKLGAGARAHLALAHDPDRLAGETVSHVERVIAHARR